MEEEVDTPKIETMDSPEMEAGAAPGTAPKGSIGDRLELDRMEVGPADEAQEVQEKAPENPVPEPAVPQDTESRRASLFALLAGNWIWGVALLLAVFVVSAVLWFTFALTGKTELRKQRSGSPVVTASLGGEHYVHFRILGPFGDPEGQRVLRRAMAKIKDDLILSGGQPEVARSIEQGDMKFLKRYILRIVSDKTGVPIEELDLKGLSVTRYSDEEEIRRERGS